jgi:hypothetical protein
VPLNFILFFKTSPVLVLIFTCNVASRFRQLKEQENRRKLNKTLASGDSKASAYDSEDEESDDETEEEVFLTHFRYLYIFL